MRSDRHILSTFRLPPSAVRGFAAYVNSALQLWQCGLLVPARDGRKSAGPLDLPAFLTLVRSTNHTPPHP